MIRLFKKHKNAIGRFTKPKHALCRFEKHNHMNGRFEKHLKFLFESTTHIHVHVPTVYTLLTVLNLSKLKKITAHNRNRIEPF